MKNENGVTLISLIIYVILMIIVVAIVSNITASFYSNLNDFNNGSESAVAYSKFNMIFLNDIKKENVEITGYGDGYVIFSIKKGANIELVQYSIQDNSLYRNKVKICDNIKSASIDTNTDNGTIKIYMKIGEYEKVTTYVIEKNIITNNTQII